MSRPRRRRAGSPQIPRRSDARALRPSANVRSPGPSGKRTMLCGSHRRATVPSRAGTHHASLRASRLCRHSQPRHGDPRHLRPVAARPSRPGRSRCRLDRRSRQRPRPRRPFLPRSVTPRPRRVSRLEPVAAGRHRHPGSWDVSRLWRRTGAGPARSLATSPTARLPALPSRPHARRTVSSPAEATMLTQAVRAADARGAAAAARSTAP